MKKLLSVFLALVLTLSLAAVAMAQPTPSISGQWSAGYEPPLVWGSFPKVLFGQYRWFSVNVHQRSLAAG